MFEMAKCPICGKSFPPAPLHALTDGKGHFVCSPHCSTMAQKNSKDNKIERQEMEAEKNKERDRQRKERKKTEQTEQKRKPRNNGGIAKPVCIYTKDGEFIKRFPSVNAAARATGFEPASVSAICRGLQQSRGKYTFRYESPETDTPVIVTRSKPVIQYDCFGEFIARYPSLTEASKKTGVCVSSISQNCSGLSKTAKGYLFRYEERGKQNEDENYS